MKRGVRQQQKPKEVKNGNTEFNLMRMLRVLHKPYNITWRIASTTVVPNSIFKTDTEHAFYSCAYVLCWWWSSCNFQTFGNVNELSLQRKRCSNGLFSLDCLTPYRNKIFILWHRFRKMAIEKKRKYMIDKVLKRSKTKATNTAPLAFFSWDCPSFFHRVISLNKRKIGWTISPP